MQTLGANKSRDFVFARPLSVYDIFLVTIVFLIAFVVATSWSITPQIENIPLINSVGLTTLIAALGFVMVAIYIFFKALGKGQWLSILNPAIIIGIFSIPVWLIFNGLLALYGLSSSAATSNTLAAGLGNVIIGFIGLDNFNGLLQVVIFATIESLLVAVTIGVFASVNRGPAYAILLPVAGFLALAHSAVAVALSPTLTFSTVLLHQFFSFIILGILQIQFGTAANVSAHWYKNLLANRSPILWVIILAFTAATFLLTIRPGDTKRLQQAAVRTDVV